MTKRTTNNGKPSKGKRSVRELLPGRGNPPASGRRPPGDGFRGLLGRVQATLPGAKRNAEKSGSQKVVAALGKATSNTAAHKPSTRSMLGILAGGVGAAAVAKRRHNPEPEQLPETSPAQPDQTSDRDSPQLITTVTDSSTDTGGDHGDPQGPDPAAAA
jgi:hypothetical protein